MVLEFVKKKLFPRILSNQSIKGYSNIIKVSMSTPSNRNSTPENIPEVKKGKSKIYYKNS